MDIRNLLRDLQASPNISAIQRATGLNRRTIMRYRTWAEQHSLLDQPLPSLEELQHLVATTLQPATPPQTVSSLELYRDIVLQLHTDGVEGTAILQRLRERGYSGSVSSVYSFLKHHAPQRPKPRFGSNVTRVPKRKSISAMPGACSTRPAIPCARLGHSS